MLHVEQHAGFGAHIAFIHQHGAAFQQVPIAFQGEVNDGIEQGMARTDKGSQRLALWSHQGFFKGNPLVTRQDGLANADEAVPVPYRGGDMSDFVAAGFTLLDGAAKALEGFVKEGFDVMGLQAAGVGTFHVLSDALNLAGIHGVVREHPFFKQFLKMATVECGVEHRGEESFDLGLFTMADGLNQQVAQGFAFELEFAEHVEHLPPERLTRLFKLFQ